MCQLLKSFTMMKKIIFCFAALFVMTGARADDLLAHLQMRDRTVRQIVLDGNSEIQLQHFMLKVRASVSTEYDILFLIEDVANLSFSQVPTGIDHVPASVLSYRWDNETLYIEGIQGDEAVSVYNVAGVLLYRQPVKNGTCNLSLSAMPKGMLLVKVNHETLKILKK